MLLKGLLHFLQVLQKADIIGKLVGALGNSRQHAHHPAVHLPGVGLA